MATARTDFDVVVVGGGIAGLTAGLAAAERGGRVRVLEKAGEIGGNARLAAGIFLGSRDAAGLHDYIPDGDAELQRIFCDDYEPTLAWLESHGLPIAPLVLRQDFRVARPMGLGRPGDRAEFLEALARRVTERGGMVRTDATVTKLARVSGGLAISATVVEWPHRVTARSVVLATGGFAASPALLERYMGPAATALRTRSRPGAGGDGLSLGLALGAATAGDMQAFYGHSMADCPLAPDEWQPLTPYFARIGVLVNRDGRRFADESASLLEETNPQLGFRQPGGIYWLIFDDRILRGEGAEQGSDAGLPSVDWLGRARALGAPIVEAAGVDALADALAAQGVAAAVRDEIGRYNDACRAGTAARLDPPKRRNALALDGSPLYALRCVAGITATCGGLAIDANGRVLDAGRRPLPSLYAAGVDAGGVFGKTYGGFLSWSAISGRRAGAQAMADAAAPA
jgi:succinate dehydrogenase/fumarate reductase flavoprotein subunit